MADKEAEMFRRGELTKASGVSEVLPKGLPVLVIGTMAADTVLLADSAAVLCYAGILSEPYCPGLGLLMKPGPMAAELSPRGVEKTYEEFWITPRRIFVLFRSYPDARSCVQYHIVPDDSSLAIRIQAEAIPTPATRLVRRREIIDSYKSAVGVLDRPFRRYVHLPGKEGELMP